MSTRGVTLRNEVDGPNRRYLVAAIVDNDLQISGHDIGPATGVASDDGEYEWCRTVQRHDIAALVAALGGEAGEDILDLLTRVAAGEGSYELERLLREGVVPNEVHVF